MAIAAGERITADRLNPIAFQLRLTAPYTLTSTPTVLTLDRFGGGSATVDVPAGGMVGLGVITADIELRTAAAITACVVEPLINGSPPTDPPQVIWDPSSVAAPFRNTLSQCFPLDLPPGAYEFGLQTFIDTAAAPSVRLNARHTNLMIFLHP